MDNMNVSIIGGSGFVGTRLTARLLNSGHKVKLLDINRSIRYPDYHIFCDVRDVLMLKEYLVGSDVVINLAAEHRDDVSPKILYDEVNVQGAENVCLVCSQLNIPRIIFTSSVAIYGFAPIGTDENGAINYFNDYGRTKWQAEEIYRKWLKDDVKRSLTIIRPTVIFGEQNRGNVYNLLRQIAKGNFIMVGDGKNVKSMAYVENVAAFIEYNISNREGEKIYNYVDGPDYDMNSLVSDVYRILNKKKKVLHWPYAIGYFGGLCFDFFSFLTKKKFIISSIRVKKFCANTMFCSINIKNTDFIPPITLRDGLKKTVINEFVEKKVDHVFITE